MRQELGVTLFIAVILLIVSSGLMFYFENPVQPELFSSIPASMWWGVTALTTVGYGDVYPITIAGRCLGSVVAFLGIGFFALPAGIVGSGFVEMIGKEQAERERKEPTDERDDRALEAVMLRQTLQALRQGQTTLAAALLEERLRAVEGGSSGPGAQLEERSSALTSLL